MQCRMELPSEVGGGAAYDVVAILVHLQEGAVLTAILPELHAPYSNQIQET